MNPETLYFVAVALCGLGLLIAGVVTYSLVQRVRALEAQLQEEPRRFRSDALGVRGGVIIVDEGLPTIRETKLPRGRGLT